MHFILTPGQLTLDDIRRCLDESTTIALAKEAEPRIHASADFIQTCLKRQQVIYGVNTGFGALASTRIADADLDDLQRRIVLSHAAGTGEPLSDLTVRLILLLKINSLARGYSGIRLSVIETLITLFNHRIYPVIPSQGSVGASGDLAPLAHLSTVLLGVGEARHQGQIYSAADALALADLRPCDLIAKEGLALLNGTQVSTALALLGLFQAENVLIGGLAAGALSVDAARGSDTPFDERIHAIRGHASQITIAKALRELLKDSEIRESHRDCAKVQDPYSLRCQPQVMGACLNQCQQAAAVLTIEANAVSDNPLIFSDDEAVLSGGNFHAEPVAFVADNLALAIAEIGALSERRTALLVDPHFSGLPAFLVENPGMNSGFMIAQVTAAALASENKALAHPSSVDSLPTSANQEDHVSMATYAARRLLRMAENTSAIIAIELLAAAQGIDFLAPLKTSPKLLKLHQLIRSRVAFYAEDRYFAPDIEKIKQLVSQGHLRDETGLVLLTDTTLNEAVNG